MDSIFDEAFRGINRKQEVTRMVQKLKSIFPSILKEAKRDERLVMGLMDAAVYIERNAENVRLCVIPDSNMEELRTNASLQVCLTLIEAFCAENQIPVLRVDCLREILLSLENGDSSSSDPFEGEDCQRRRTKPRKISLRDNLNCLLITASPRSKKEAQFYDRVQNLHFLFGHAPHLSISSSPPD